MKLISKFFENAFEIKSKTLNTIVIEDTKIFTAFLKELVLVKNGASSEFGLVENYKELDLSKISDIIFDLFNLELNGSSILKKMYAELESDLNSEEMYLRKIELNDNILSLANDLAFRSRFSISISEVNYQMIFKAVGMSFDYDKESILDRLIEYINIAHELLAIKLFILINLDSFLAIDELVELIDFLKYNEIRILNLQNKINRKTLEFENLRIIDIDLCEI